MKCLWKLFHVLSVLLLSHYDKLNKRAFGRNNVNQTLYIFLKAIIFSNYQIKKNLIKYVNISKINTSKYIYIYIYTYIVYLPT